MLVLAGFFCRISDILLVLLGALFLKELVSSMIVATLLILLGLGLTQNARAPNCCDAGNFSVGRSGYYVNINL